MCVLLTVGGTAMATDQTITLSVENMTCSLCPPTVRKALHAVEGVREANVFIESKTAVVIYDDEKTNVQSLMAATTNAGFPSTLTQED
jgi:mercuric ion binding protein